MRIWYAIGEYVRCPYAFVALGPVRRFPLTDDTVANLFPLGALLRIHRVHVNDMIFVTAQTVDISTLDTIADWRFSRRQTVRPLR